MTYRVYVRWPYSKVSDKTTTDSRHVADVAFDELVARRELATQGALGVAFTEGGKQIVYHALRVDQDHPNGGPDERGSDRD